VFSTLGHAKIYIGIMRSYLISKYKQLVMCSQWLQLFHELCIGKSFRREVLSVYAGFKAHRKLEKGDGGRVFALRRNIHRIEKGLIMSPRREVFALDYIDETVAAYVELMRECEREYAAELKWFHDVLSEYFNATTSHAVIDEARVKFEKAELNSSSSVQASVPMARQEYELADISYEDFYKLCKQRRSVRWYRDDPVPRELVDKAIAAAAQSPSACNRQPFEFRIFDQKEMVKKVSAIPGGTVGFSHQFPMMVVLVGKLSAYEFVRDRHLIYIDASLAAMSFMFALETLGLSSCSINWPGIESIEREMDTALGLEPYERPIMLISVGFAAEGGLIPFSEKRGLDELRRYN
jgi:nitroreductase